MTLILYILLLIFVFCVGKKYQEIKYMQFLKRNKTLHIYNDLYMCEKLKKNIDIVEKIYYN